MANIITTLHPENDNETNLYPNIKKENIPARSVDMSKLDSSVISLLSQSHEITPSGVDTSTNILAFTSDKGIWIGSDTGYWYYWDGTHYVSGGAYQAIQATYSSLDTNLKEKIKLVDIFKNTLYSDISLSIEASDYENGNYQYDFINVIPVSYKAALKITVHSYGYIAVAIQNGNVPSGVSITSTLVDDGDVLIATGTIINGNANRVYVYSPNSVVCDIEILYVNDIEKINDITTTIEQMKYNEIIVDANGNGDYSSLDDALKYANDSANNPVVITVRAGTYTCRTETPTDAPYQKNNRYLVIRGEDVNNTIIRNDNGYYSPYTSDSGGLLYDSSPIRISGNVTIENLTIISTDTNYTEWLSEHPDCAGLIGAQSYCIHTDFNCDENTTTLIRNCKMINDHHCCIGAGTRKNHLIQIENCELETTIDTSLLPSLDNAVIFVHSYNLNSGNAYEGQRVLVKNNIITNTNKVKACYFYASSPDRIYATLIGNVCKTTDTQNGFISYGDAYGITLTDYCFGNNIETMNSISEFLTDVEMASLISEVFD